MCERMCVCVCYSKCVCMWLCKCKDIQIIKHRYLEEEFIVEYYANVLRLHKTLIEAMLIFNDESFVL